MYRVRLVEDAKQAWRWSSIRFLALGGVVQGALVSAPATITQYVPDWLLRGLATFSLICIILAGVGRMTQVEKSDVGKSGS